MGIENKIPQIKPTKNLMLLSKAIPPLESIAYIWNFSARLSGINRRQVLPKTQEQG
jgi:hypothetical protein